VAGENREITRRLIGVNHSGPPDETVERAIELVHPEFEFVSRLSAIDGASYRGEAGARRYYADMSDAWRDWRVELEAIEELGSDLVLGQVIMHAVGQSGVAIDLRSWMVVEVVDGKVRRMGAHSSREEALEAAGFGD
jgi:hypothetical protein